MTKYGVVDIDDHGWGTFTCFANEVQVWIKLPEGAAAFPGESVSNFNLCFNDLKRFSSQIPNKGVGGKFASLRFRSKPSQIEHWKYEGDRNPPLE